MTDYTPRYPPAVGERAARLGEVLAIHGNAYVAADLTTEQEIRISALESAVRYWAVESAQVTPGAVLAVAERFAAYITDGTIAEAP